MMLFRPLPRSPGRVLPEINSFPQPVVVLFAGDPVADGQLTGHEPPGERSITPVITHHRPRQFAGHGNLRSAGPAPEPDAEQTPRDAKETQVKEQGGPASE